MRYRKTLSLLDSFLTANRRNLTHISPILLADWAASLLQGGLSPTTVLRHLNILSGLMKHAAKAGIIPPDDAPRTLAKAIQATGTATPAIPPLLNAATLHKILTILRATLSEDPAKAPQNVYTDIITLSLLHGATPIDEIILLKKSAADTFAEAGHTIITRNSDPRREYIFPLRQSYLTPRQIKAETARAFARTFGHIPGITADTDPDELIRSIWAACAMQCGLTASRALRHASGPAPLAIPAFCTTDTPEETTGDDKATWNAAVAALLLHDAPRWYAMRLRRNVTFDDLRRDIADHITPAPELFYPCDTIMRLRNGRKTIEDVPLISGTAFFRTRPEKIAPMFARIGDKAWCYRHLGAPGAPYAEIPRSDMARFQRAIGIFTPDIEIRPLGAITPRPGDKVIVIMPGLGRHPGEIEEIRTKKSAPTIYRIKLSTDQGYEFRVDADPRQLEI